MEQAGTFIETYPPSLKLRTGKQFQYTFPIQHFFGKALDMGEGLRFPACGRQADANTTGNVSTLSVTSFLAPSGSELATL